MVMSRILTLSAFISFSATIDKIAPKTPSANTANIETPINKPLSVSLKKLSRINIGI
jgi:hypothetical protein